MPDAPKAYVKSWMELPIDVPMALIERRRVIGQQAMISHVTLRRGCFVASHSHENEQFSCIVSGKLKFGFGTLGAADFHEVIAGPGDIVVMPSFAPHSAEAIEDTVVLDIFSPPSATTGIDRKDRGH